MEFSCYFSIKIRGGEFLLKSVFFLFIYNMTDFKYKIFTQKFWQKIIRNIILSQKQNKKAAFLLKYRLSFFSIIRNSYFRDFSTEYRYIKHSNFFHVSGKNSFWEQIRYNICINNKFNH